MSDYRRHRVVLNDEQQYAVWPADLPVPAGWRPEGFEGTREECVERVDLVWVDMRPASLRRSEREARA
ncbi:MbtH family protein (plasmid) [Streptomyces sp. BI20]|uniref:MbtH family protein n=1 Tax=Streptomyces sp. BI20 TaxID=3403460 RepID=UPI003C7862F9